MSSGLAGSLPSRPGVVALIPALNEAPNLPGLIDSLARAGVQSVVVADNGSTDGTGEVAERAGARVVREPRRGYGAACLAGMRLLAADPVPPRIVLFLDGDRSDDPDAVAGLLAPIRAGEADLVMGARVLGEEDASPPHQRLGTRLMLYGARLLHGTRFRDMGPFRAIRWSTLVALEMDDRTWGWTLQMQLRAYHLGARIREVPVARRPRSAGRSKVSGSLWISVRVGVRMAFTLLRERLRARHRGPDQGSAARKSRTARSETSGASSAGR